ncbi:MAG TPA: ATP-binding protein [Candidatus Angelobacter sp.]|nr:ATP-binding protein [Candidatus Angelobacter sp.]
MKERATPRWLDVLWLLFLAGLALLPPISEIHKQATLFIIGAFQLLENRFVRATGRWGPACAVAIKLALATFLINHTNEPVAINSDYYPIYYLPVMTAAMYYGPVGTLLWTLAASGAYSSYLYQAGKHFTITADSISQLAMRLLFFFFVAMTVNRFVMQYRLQAQRYQELSESLAEANRNLKLAQEEARRAERLAALGQLSAGLAHEIRNPLGVIKGSAEILTQKLKGADPLAQELSGYIYTEVNRVSALVGRFLDFARPSQLDLAPIDVEPLVERCLKIVSEQEACEGVKFRREFAPGLPQIMLDQDLCEQVFVNLLMNACEAMSGPSGEVNVRVQPAPEAAGVMVEIEDNGPGVPLELKEQIFNPFVTTKKSGVGLGLAIVSKIVDAHGGSVKLISPAHQGACFRVTFPVPVEAGITEKNQNVTTETRKHGEGSESRA